MLEVCTRDMDAVIDLNDMQEMCKVSGKTMNIQRVRKRAHVGKSVESPPKWFEELHYCGRASSVECTFTHVHNFSKHNEFIVL